MQMVNDLERRHKTETTVDRYSFYSDIQLAIYGKYSLDLFAVIFLKDEEVFLNMSLCFVVL